jgi:hypothetical protein
MREGGGASFVPRQWSDRRELLESSLPLLFWRIQTVHAFDMLTHVCGMASAFVGAVLSFALVLAVFVGSRVELGHCPEVG